MHVTLTNEAQAGQQQTIEIARTDAHGSDRIRISATGSFYGQWAGLGGYDFKQVGYLRDFLNEDRWQDYPLETVIEFLAFKCGLPYAAYSFPREYGRKRIIFAEPDWISQFSRAFWMSPLQEYLTVDVGSGETVFAAGRQDEAVFHGWMLAKSYLERQGTGSIVGLPEETWQISGRPMTLVWLPAASPDGSQSGPVALYRVEKRS